MKERFYRRVSLIIDTTLNAFVMFQGGIKGVKNWKIVIMSQGLVLTRFFSLELIWIRLENSRFPFTNEQSASKAEALSVEFRGLMNLWNSGTSFCACTFLLRTGCTVLFRSPKAGVPNLQDLMPDDLRWSWCNNNQNKVHNKCKAFESSHNHPASSGLWKYCLPWNCSLVPKRLGTTAHRDLWPPLQVTGF